MSLGSPGDGGQLVGVAQTVVHTVDHGPLDRNPTPRLFTEQAAAVNELGDGVPSIHRHELISQLVVGGVKRQCQPNLKAFVGQVPKSLMSRLVAARTAS